MEAIDGMAPMVNLLYLAFGLSHARKMSWWKLLKNSPMVIFKYQKINQVQGDML